MNANEKQPVAPGKQNGTSEMIREPISNSMTISNEAVEVAIDEIFNAFGSVVGTFAKNHLRPKIRSAITRVCAERDEEIEAWKQNGLNAVAGKDREILALSAQLAEMKDALKLTEWVSCASGLKCGCCIGIYPDHQAGCLVHAALSSFPAAATKEERTSE